MRSLSGSAWGMPVVRRMQSYARRRPARKGGCNERGAGALRGCAGGRPTTRIRQMPPALKGRRVLWWLLLRDLPYSGRVEVGNLTATAPSPLT
jgi:hypothetical protein